MAPISPIPHQDLTNTSPIPHIHRTRLRLPLPQRQKPIPAPIKPTRHRLIIVLTLPIIINVRTRRPHLLPGPLRSALRAAGLFSLVHGRCVARGEVLHRPVDLERGGAGTQAYAGDGDAGCAVV